MDLQLRGRSVLITGASKGIGEAAARVFAAEGCSLHLAARSAEALERLAAEIRQAHGVEASVHALDLARPGSVDAVADAAGAVDILVNNAGDVPPGSIETLAEEDWRRGFELKLFGYILLTRRIYEAMAARGSGVIVNNIGNSGENWDYDYVAGSTANAALMAFTRAVGGRSLDRGVRVVGVSPGPTETERIERFLRRRALGRLGDEERWREALSDYPGGRLCSAGEIADMIAFLASPRAGYVTGTIVTVDGGIAAFGSVIKPRPPRP